MRMNVKSPGPPFTFGVVTLPREAVKFIVTHLFVVSLYANLLFLGRQKVNYPPLNFPGQHPLLKNECSLKPPICISVVTKLATALLCNR